MDDLGLTTQQIRDHRYEAIIHMMTAADGAKEFYTSMISGEARYESFDEAKEKDELLRQAYMGHQKWCLIKNSDCVDFKDKIQKAKEAVLDVLGKHTGTHFHKKFLLKKEKRSDTSMLPLNLQLIDKKCFEEIYISETYIDYKTSEGEILSCSVEKKGSKQSFTYTLKVNLLVNNQKLLKKRHISATEYIHYKG